MRPMGDRLANLEAAVGGGGDAAEIQIVISSDFFLGSDPAGLLPHVPRHVCEGWYGEGCPICKAVDAAMEAGPCDAV
jgi:hypothetical protein